MVAGSMTFLRRVLADNGRGVLIRPGDLILSRRLSASVGAAGNVLVLRIETRVNNHTPRLTTIEDLQFTGSLIDAYAETINEHDDHAPPPDIVNPMDGDMRAHAFMWNRPPYKLDTGGDETPHTWKAIVFLNLSRIRSFLDTSDPEYVFTIHFPASEHHTEGGTVYWAFADPFGNPFEYYLEHPATTGAVIDADGHTGIVIARSHSGARRSALRFLAGMLDRFRRGTRSMNRYRTWT